MSPVKKIFAITALTLSMSLAHADAISDSQAKVQNYDNLISQINAQITSEQNEMGTINDRIDTAKRLIAGLNPNTETSDNLIKLQTISERLIARKNELNTSVSDNRTKIAELAKSKQSFIESQANLVTQSTYTSDIQTAINNKKTENDKLNTEKLQLEAQIQSIEKQIKDVKIKNDQLITQKKDYDSFIKQVDDDIKESQKVLDQKKQQSDDYKALISEQDKQNLNLSQKIESQKIEKQQKEQELSKAITDEKANNQKLVAQKDDIVKQNQQIANDIAEAKKTYQANVTVKEQMTKKIQSLESDLTVSKKKIKEINNQNIALFEAAKRSLVQNNQDIDTINTDTIGATLKPTDVDNTAREGNVKSVVSGPVPISAMIDSSKEKNILVTKAFGDNDILKKAAPVTSSNIYTVKRGDTLGSIVKSRYSTKSLSDSMGIVSDIEKMNSLSNSDMISVGQQLKMPNYNNL